MVMTSGRRRPNSFLSDPDYEFEFFLAEKLGMTRQQLRNNMSEREFIEWSRYYAVQAQRQDLAAKQAKSRGRR